MRQNLATLSFGDVTGFKIAAYVGQNMLESNSMLQPYNAQQNASVTEHSLSVPSCSFTATHSIVEPCHITQHRRAMLRHTASLSHITSHSIVEPCHVMQRPCSTMECSQPSAWTTNRSLLVASCVRPFQEDRPIPTRPYPELRTWMVVRSGVISVFPTHSGNAPESPDIRPTTWLCPACLPSTNSIPAPIQPTIAMTTTHIHQL